MNWFSRNDLWTKMQAIQKQYAYFNMNFLGKAKDYALGLETDTNMSFWQFHVFASFVMVDAKSI